MMNLENFPRYASLICEPEKESGQEDRASRVRSANPATAFSKQLLDCFSN